MHGGQCAINHVVEHREMETFQMEMQDIEVSSSLADLREHRQVGWNIPRQFGVEPEGYFSARDKFSGRFAVATRKQRHLVPSMD
jgi:hypothetical protein